MKKAQIIITMLLITCHLGQPALAETVFGEPDCGQWLTKKREPDKAWALGYLSGLSVMHELNGKVDDPLAKINSAEQIFVWLDNYCQKNPLKGIGNGGLSLFLEVMRNKK